MITRRGNHEILDFGHGLPTGTAEPTSVAPPDVGPANQLDEEPPPSPDAAHQRRHDWLTLTLTFLLGLTAGTAAPHGLHATSGNADVALVAGPVTIGKDVSLPGDGTGATFSVDQTTGTAPVAVPVHNMATDSVDVVAVLHIGQLRAAPSTGQHSVTVPAGDWRTVSTAVRLDCQQPAPKPATEVELRVRTDMGELTSVAPPLARPAADLTSAWQKFCV